MNNLVSVIIPCYNAELYVEDAVRSIMTQSYKDLEIIVINDSSTDRTKEILLSLKSEDPRVIYIENRENLKLIKTLNLGFSIAKGQFVVRMDADDISEPERIQMQVDFLNQNQDYGLVGTSGVYLVDDKIRGKFPKPVTDQEIKRELFLDSPFIHPSVMFRKDIIEEYDENFYQVEDYALWVKLSKKTKFYNLPKALIRYRILANSETRKSQANYLRRHQALKAVYRYLFEINDYQINEVELDQYTYSMFRPNFDKINPYLLKKVYQQITKKNKDKGLMMRLSERWFATLILGRYNVRDIGVYMCSPYTYWGLWSLILKKVKYVFR